LSSEGSDYPHYELKQNAMWNITSREKRELNMAAVGSDCYIHADQVTMTICP